MNWYFFASADFDISSRWSFRIGFTTKIDTRYKNRTQILSTYRLVIVLAVSLISCSCQLSIKFTELNEFHAVFPFFLASDGLDTINFQNDVDYAGVKQQWMRFLSQYHFQNIQRSSVYILYQSDYFYCTIIVQRLKWEVILISHMSEIIRVFLNQLYF